MDIYIEKNIMGQLRDIIKESIREVVSEQHSMKMWGMDITKSLDRLTPEQELMVDYIEENYKQFRGEPDENAGDIQWEGSPEPHPTAILYNMNGDSLLRIEFDNKRMYIDEDVFYFNQPLFKFKQIVDKNYKIQ